MERYNVSTKKVFKSGDKEQVRWNQVGTFVQMSKADGDKHDGLILELNMFPETKFYFFPVKDREPGQDG